MIKLARVCVEGFRLLEGIDIAIEGGATVIVGRNNSGKTSLTEVFDRFLGEQAGRFRLEDFAAAVRPKFLTAKALRDSDESAPHSVLAELPVIALTLTFSYDQNAGDLGPLSPFVIDLDPDCTIAIARIEYSAGRSHGSELSAAPQGNTIRVCYTHQEQGLGNARVFHLPSERHVRSLFARTKG